jgi:hypothetical protein
LIISTGCSASMPNAQKWVSTHFVCLPVFKRINS